jgi:hypothetical protein
MLVIAIIFSDFYFIYYVCFVWLMRLKCSFRLLEGDNNDVEYFPGMAEEEEDKWPYRDNH